MFTSDKCCWRSEKTVQRDPECLHWRRSSNGLAPSYLACLWLVVTCIQKCHKILFPARDANVSPHSELNPFRCSRGIFPQTPCLAQLGPVDSPIAPLNPVDLVSLNSFSSFFSNIHLPTYFPLHHCPSNIIHPLKSGRSDHPRHNGLSSYASFTCRLLTDKRADMLQNKSRPRSPTSSRSTTLSFWLA